MKEKKCILYLILILASVSANSAEEIKTDIGNYIDGVTKKFNDVNFSQSLFPPGYPECLYMAYDLMVEQAQLSSDYKQPKGILAPNFVFWGNLTFLKKLGLSEDFVVNLLSFGHGKSVLAYAVTFKIKPDDVYKNKDKLLEYKKIVYESNACKLSLFSAVSFDR